MLRAIIHATAITPGGVVEDASVLIEEGRIAGVRRGRERAPGDATLDARGAFVVPGLVDLHSDAIEGQIAPRPGVRFPLDLAFAEIDRLLAGAAITTCLHAISFMLSQQRTVAAAQQTHDLVLASRDDALVRHELHLRCELPQPDSVEAVLGLLREGRTRLVSAMDHTPGQGQFRDVDWYRRYQSDTRQSTSADIEEAVARGARDHRERLPQLARLADAARSHGVLLASHDDDDPDRVRLACEHGAAISEFPITLAAARAAHERGVLVCMGAPNVVRGQSTGGNLSATEAIGLGLVDVLCSDYHPPSMVRAAFRLAADGVIDLPQAVGLVTHRPARAVGLDDRGSLDTGNVADLALVQVRQGLPTPIATIVGGHPVAGFAGSGAIPSPTSVVARSTEQESWPTSP